MPVTQTALPHDSMTPTMPIITLVLFPTPISTMCFMLLCWKAFSGKPHVRSRTHHKQVLFKHWYLFLFSPPVLLSSFFSLDEWSAALCPSPTDPSLGLYKADTIYDSIRTSSITVINKGSFRPPSSTSTGVHLSSHTHTLLVKCWVCVGLCVPSTLKSMPAAPYLSLQVSMMSNMQTLGNREEFSGPLMPSCFQIRYNFCLTMLGWLNLRKHVQWA